MHLYTQPYIYIGYIKVHITITPLHSQKNFPGVPITALTATATSRVREDILKLLGMRRARVFKVTCVL